MSILKIYKWTVACSALVVLLLLLPAQIFPKTPRGMLELDKIVHGFLFGIVTAVFCAEHRRWARVDPPLLLSFVIIGTFSFLTEVSQLATKTRHFDLKDFGADLIGIAAGLLLMRLIAGMAQK
jgi:VanZ family protein